MSIGEVALIVMVASIGLGYVGANIKNERISEFFCVAGGCGVFGMFLFFFFRGVWSVQ